MWHLKTDGQSKITNQKIERYLWSYVNHFQNDCVDCLPMAKLSSNANTSATTKIAPFLAFCGYIPRMSFKPVDLTALSTRKQLANTKTKLIANRMQEVWKFKHAKMAKSQQAQVKAANKNWKVNLEYKIGDLVWLSIKNIHTERLSKKLDHKKISPYKVIELVELSYQLELLESMSIHNVFYPSLLRPAAKDPISGQHNDPPSPVVVNEKKSERSTIFLMPRNMGDGCYSKSNGKAITRISSGIYQQISKTLKKLWMTFISKTRPSLRCTKLEVTSLQRQPEQQQSKWLCIESNTWSWEKSWGRSWWKSW